MVVAGVDAGTKSYDIAILEKGEIFVESFPTEKIRKDPEPILETLERHDVEISAGLSGYGIPIKPFFDLTENEVKLMTLNLEASVSVGLRKLINEIIKRKLKFYTVPAIIHIQTIPAWRKFNKIDLGTSDKLCSAVLAAFELSEEVEIEKQNFILAEVGYGFSSFVAVKDGKIVDALGGTSGFMGFSSIGSIDAELAYLLGGFSKNLIFSGGVKSFVEEYGGDEIEILAEFVMKGFKSMEVSVPDAEFILSGRFAEKLSKKLGYRVLRGFGKGKQSAEGAALIADAISGGKSRRIVKSLGVFDAKGTVLDYLSRELKEIVLKRLNMHPSTFQSGEKE